LNTNKTTSTLRVGKATVSAAPLIGAPWGSMWEVCAAGGDDDSDGGGGGGGGGEPVLERVTEAPRHIDARADEIDKDNSRLVDANEANQALKAEDIEELKRAGAVRRGGLLLMGMGGGINKRNRKHHTTNPNPKTQTKFNQKSNQTTNKRPATRLSTRSAPTAPRTAARPSLLRPSTAAARRAST
jgi:hypothetical protein